MKLVTFKDTRTRLPARRILQMFELIASEEADPEWRATVNVVFVTDQKVRRLNRQYRGKNRATDVLSFNIDPPGEKDNVFGEIYISVDTALRQARQIGGTLSGEYLRLLCHGLLHLFGYDDGSRAEATRMEARERYYLRRLRESGE